MNKDLINFKLPEELKNKKIGEPTLISWVFSIEASSLISDYERTSGYYNEHFYFEKAVDQSSIYGIGEIVETFSSILTNATVAMTGPVELSSGLFDEKTNNTANWGNLDQSVSYLPKIIRTEKHLKQWVTINIVVKSNDDLRDVWVEKMKELNVFFEIENTVNSLPTNILMKEELKVSEWLKTVSDCVAHLKESETLDKIVLARQLKVTTEKNIQPIDVLKKLRREQPDTYRFVVAKNQTYFIGATPERLLQATKEEFATVCVAGSIKRGKNAEEDFKLGTELLNDQKNVMEHHYVVKWLQEEMSQLTTSLEDNIPVSLLKNRDIQHLFLPIRGQRKSGISFLDGIKALHPSPALGGLPKEEATKWIREHEYYARGLYGGPLGWRNIVEDTGEMVVGIRSGIITGNTAILYAGCGIVEASIPELEREETKVKFQPMLRALGDEINE